jgi:hypothetical protein
MARRIIEGRFGFRAVIDRKESQEIKKVEREAHAISVSVYKCFQRGDEIMDEKRRRLERCARFIHRVDGYQETALI